jgi:hypothetical protein
MNYGYDWMGPSMGSQAYVVMPQKNNWVWPLIILIIIIILVVIFANNNKAKAGIAGAGRMAAVPVANFDAVAAEEQQAQYIVRH